MPKNKRTDSGMCDRIKGKRVELGLTQLELAQRMGYKSKAAICKVEKGEDNITSTRIMKFAEALGVTPLYLLGFEDEYGNPIGPVKMEVTQEEKSIIEKWRALDEESKKQIILMMAFFKSESEKK